MAETYRFDCGCEFEVLGPPPTPGGLPLLKYSAYEDTRPDCAATWSLLGRGHTKGVFQLEKQLGQQWARTLRPEHIDHMSALGALLRPGCLKAVDEDGVSMTQHYCR